MAKRAKKKSGKKTGKKAGQRARRSTASARAGKGGSALASLSVADLQLELRRRQRVAGKLMRRRDRLMRDLQAVNEEIAAMGAAGEGVTPSGRARNSMTLPDALAEVLSGVTMSVTEAADAVRASGYHSTAANFRTMVNQALLRDKRFKKVSRGKYTA